MTYEELVKEAAKALKNLDLKTAPEHLAVEFDVEGEGEGAFYVEFTQKKANVEPYEYYDHDLRVRDNAEQILKLLKGEVSCYEVNVEGFAEELNFLKNRKAARKATTAKKTATTAKKATKTVAEKATTTAKKATTTAKKAASEAAKAVEAKATEVKAEVKTAAKTVEKKAATKAADKASK